MGYMAADIAVWARFAAAPVNTVRYAAMAAFALAGFVFVISAAAMV